jgi:hypothetical protein
MINDPDPTPPSVFADRSIAPLLEMRDLVVNDFSYSR